MSSGFLPLDPHDSQRDPEGIAPVDGGAVELPEDVYARIVEQVRQISGSLSEGHSTEDLTQIVAEMVGELNGESVHEGSTLSSSRLVENFLPIEIPVPTVPMTLAETGVSLKMLADLTLKILYLSGSETCETLSRQLRLPVHLAAEGLQQLLIGGSIGMESGHGDSISNIRYQLTEQGRVEARDVFSRNRYVGPAPVSLDQYTRQCQAQSVSRLRLTPQQLADTFTSEVLSSDLLNRLGPAVCSGQAILLSGPSGSGKTLIAKRLGQLVRECGGTIYVPYAISIENQILSLFDPTCHHPVENQAEDHNDARDLRWREVRRPVLSCTGELNLELFQLKGTSTGGAEVAPMQLKANGGVLVLDDIGRQRLPSSELLNRWILPLEESKDRLTMRSGKSILIPYELLTIFTTNRASRDWADSAFLRRIRHKLELEVPTGEQYREIFRRCCESRHIRYDDWIVTRLLTTQYNAEHSPKASDPGDLLDVIEAICRFKGEMPHLSEQIVIEAFRECFGNDRTAA
ncbi:MAG TPA: ATPase [Planctomicrobium sp.]|nr:ATPase [Planctomicrobium sp.]